MFEFVKRLMGQDNTAVAAPPPARGAAAPAGSLAARVPAYDSRLVETLKHDHHDLVELFQQIGQVAERGRFHELPALLVAFKTGLESHVIAENVRFYNYVENSLIGDEENLALIRSFRREMNAIARGVVDFVKKYQRAAFNEATRDAFLRDYAVVGGLLSQRIQREEASLYPLYQPN
ncbi:hemerythrin domain-containing protein [Aquimonas voraii]|uniref:Hemerythrin HHE cation binding domain-containing protein n=1 Tax=Aquimonas voraii TaxID=265719 RepID=A0A1G6XXC0_9GAMM|nr:hemerythrin domain-containing protein [Aquimonas voraii]SDD82809.1 Hemerythrin HHE cation binding domain-containing protein [Aquimonas voraii]